ncbi:MAG: nuclear transport factor 2 family protein [Christiangramia sp.]|nr:hypothetical protein [Christiangramia sp.]
MKTKISIITVLLVFFVLPGKAQTRKTDLQLVQIQNKIEASINQWHRSAAKADFDAYFNLMTSDAIFIGTDATENWNVEEFKNFSKPYFDKGKAWAFTPIERHVYIDGNKKTAWFDELLDTHMGICRGSGVMKKEDGTWKIQHYVLSIAVPNENVDRLTEMKKDFDANLIQKLTNN